MKRRWTSLPIAALYLGGMLAIPGVASASTTEAIADTGGMVLELGVLGSPLNVIEVTLDDIGNVTTVAVSDPAFGEPARHDHKVVFATADDSTRIEIKAKRDELKAEVKTTNVANVVGSHTWRGKLFGSNQDAVVSFDVFENSDGFPELRNVSVDTIVPSDATFTISDVKNESDDDGEYESKATVEFKWNGFEMTLKIAAQYESDDDTERSVQLQVELKGEDEQKLRVQLLAEIAGPHTWEGRFCDGTTAAVAYTVSPVDGTVTLDGVTIDGAASDAYELKDESHGIEVKFDGQDAAVGIDVKQKEDGRWQLEVDSKTTEKCGDDSYTNDDGSSDDHNGDDDSYDDDGDSYHDDGGRGDDRGDDHKGDRGDEDGGGDRSDDGD